MPLPEAPHACTVRDIEESLSTGPQGLPDGEARARLRTYGRNVLLEEKTGRFVIFLRQFTSILVYILVAAAIISLLVSDIKDFYHHLHHPCQQHHRLLAGGQGRSVARCPQETDRE